MNDNQSIKDSLSVIRKALEEDVPKNLDQVHDNVLILNKLVKDDGTINQLSKTSLSKQDIVSALNNKLDKVFEIHLTKWLDKNIPNYLEKYFKNKDI